MPEPMAGFIRDFADEPLTNKGPRVGIGRLAPAVSGEFKNRLHVTDPLYVTPSATGWFSVDLVASDELYDGAGGLYLLWVEWLDAENSYTRRDDFEWLLYVPVGGGNIGQHLVLTSGYGQWWEVTTNTIPDGAKVGDWILNTVTGDVFRVVN